MIRAEAEALANMTRSMGRSFSLMMAVTIEMSSPLSPSPISLAVVIPFSTQS